jgi:hypothetical protein
MVVKGDYLFGENSVLDSLLNENDSNHGNGRAYYDYLKQEKVSQRSANGSEVFDLPCDDSEYNTMFMTF